MGASGLRPDHEVVAWAWNAAKRASMRTPLRFAGLAWLAVSASAQVPFIASSPALAAPSEACSAVNVLGGKQPIEVVNVTGAATRVTDGVVAAEGAAWDAPPAITSHGIGGVTFDLGELKPMSVAYLQGDANDTYLLTGSVEGKPGTFHVLGEFAKVGEHGAGLRGRTLRFPMESLRFLRIRSGHGDDEFAISELAVYCAEPTPFPPVFRIEGAPEPSARVQPAAPPRGSEKLGAAGKYLVLAAVALLGLGLWQARRRSQSTQRREP